MIPNNNKLFDCHDVHYSYLGKFSALSGVTLSIRRGERVALVGANGSGKSTFLHLLDALIFPDQGTLTFAGKELTEKAFGDESFSLAFRKKVGLIFQNPDVQLFCPTVREDIAFGPLQLGADEITIRAKIESLSAMFGIGALLDRSPHQLSIGEKRKAAFATILAGDPDALLLDEPTAGLDPKTATQLIHLLNALAQSGKTVVTATHDLHILEDIADTVYIFGQDKKIAGSGTPAEILNNRSLLEVNNLVHTHARHSKDHRRMM